MKYRKRWIVDAFKWEDQNQAEYPDWLTKEVKAGTITFKYLNTDNACMYLLVRDEENPDVLGYECAEKGDYIIHCKAVRKGDSDTIYIVEAADFEKEYEALE